MRPPAPLQPHETLTHGDANASTEKPIASAVLLRGQSVVTIAHRGTHCRLQETRAGRLILVGQGSK